MHQPHVANLSDERVSQLLHLGLTESVRPIHDLVERLSSADGEKWLGSLLGDGAFGMSGSASAALLGGQATLEELRSVKEHCKQLVAKQGAAHGEVELRASVGYFFSLAAALAQFGEMITNRSRRDLLPILRDLAAVVPEPWPGLFRQAISAAHEDPLE